MAFIAFICIVSLIVFKPSAKDGKSVYNDYSLINKKV